MKMSIVFALAASGAALAVHAAESNPTNAAPLSERQRIESLIRENQSLMEANQRLRIEAERPKTKEEAFAACMQAAKGQTSPMAAESIGMHCDQLLKK